MMKKEVIFFQAPEKGGYFNPLNSSENISEKTIYKLEIDRDTLSGTFVPVPTNFSYKKILQTLSQQHKAFKFKDNFLSGNIIRVIKPGAVYLSEKKWQITVPCYVQIEFELESIHQDFFEEQLIQINNNLKNIEKVNLSVNSITEELDSYKSLFQKLNIIDQIADSHTDLLETINNIKTDIVKFNVEIKTINSSIATLQNSISDQKKSESKNKPKRYKLGDAE